MIVDGKLDVMRFRVAVNELAGPLCLINAIVHYIFKVQVLHGAKSSSAASLTVKPGCAFGDGSMKKNTDIKFTDGSVKINESILGDIPVAKAGRTMAVGVIRNSK